MKIAASFLLIVITTLSCNTPKELNNSSYIYKSKKRVLYLIFINDSICSMENIFNCNDIGANFKVLTTTCKYKRIGDRIILRNVNFPKDTNTFIYIPPQESCKCSFLNADKRIHPRIGPNYRTQFKKYAMVPNIGIDTLFLFRNKILLTKPGEIMSSGYIFRKQVFMHNSCYP